MTRRPTIIAEIGVNFDGDLSVARRMIDSAADCGVDVVKFQTFSAEEFISDRQDTFTYWTVNGPVTENAFAMFKRLELPAEWHGPLKAYAERRGVRFMSSAADRGAADRLVALGCDTIKLASEDLINVPLLRHVARLGTDLLLSTGMADEDEIAQALRILEEAGLPARKVTLLHCVSVYPTPADQAHMARLTALRERFAVAVGYSDHTLGITAAVIATTLGARVIEKHFTLDRAAPGPDHAVAADPEEMARLVSAVDEAARMMGSASLSPSPAEAENRRLYRRGLVAARDLAAGAVLEADDLRLKRPQRGLHPFRLDSVIGRRLRHPLSMDAPVHEDDLD